MNRIQILITLTSMTCSAQAGDGLPPFGKALGNFLVRKLRTVLVTVHTLQQLAMEAVCKLVLVHIQRARAAIRARHRKVLVAVAAKTLFVRDWLCSRGTHPQHCGESQQSYDHAC